MADERSGMSSSQVTVALIGAAAVIGSAVIANSDRIFGTGPTPGQPVSPAPVPLQENAAAPAPPVSTPAREEVASTSPAVPVIGGAWRGDDGSVWEFTQDGDRFASEKSDGDERVRIDGQVSGQSVRISVDYYQASSGNLGLRIMNCEGQVSAGARQMSLSCLNPQTNVTSRATWSKV